MKIKIKRCRRVKLPKKGETPAPPVSSKIYDYTYDYTYE